MGPMSPQRLGVWTGMDVRPLAPERGHRQCSRGMVGTSLWSLPLPATHTQGGEITLSRDKCPLGGVTLTLRWAAGECIRSRGRTGDSLEGRRCWAPRLHRHWDGRTSWGQCFSVTGALCQFTVESFLWASVYPLVPERARRANEGLRRNGSL